VRYAFALENNRERERLVALIGRLNDDDLSNVALVRKYRKIHGRFLVL
jgi:hypothetical protein